MGFDDKEKQKANGALWRTASKAGTQYLNGNVETECPECNHTSRFWLRVFKNEQKQEGERTPDFRVFCTPDTRETRR